MSEWIKISKEDLAREMEERDELRSKVDELEAENAKLRGLTAYIKQTLYRDVWANAPRTEFQEGYEKAFRHMEERL